MPSRPARPLSVCAVAAVVLAVVGLAVGGGRAERVALGRRATPLFNLVRDADCGGALRRVWLAGAFKPRVALLGRDAAHYSRSGLPLVGGLLSGSYYVGGSIRGQRLVAILDTGSADFALASTLCARGCADAGEMYNPAGAAGVPCSAGAGCNCSASGQCGYDITYLVCVVTLGRGVAVRAECARR